MFLIPYQQNSSLQQKQELLSQIIDRVLDAEQDQNLEPWFMHRGHGDNSFCRCCYPTRALE